MEPTEKELVIEKIKEMPEAQVLKILAFMEKLEEGGEKGIKPDFYRTFFPDSEDS